MLRLSHISRWAIVQTATNQTVADHTWRVWLLGHSWWQHAGLEPDEWHATEQYLLLHDIHEVRTGDMPTPHKTPELKILLDDYEEALAPGVAAMYKALTPRARQFAKYCDTAESVLYLKVCGLGAHAADVTRLLEHQMLDRLQASDLPGKHVLHSLFTDAYHGT